MVPKGPVGSFDFALFYDCEEGVDTAICNDREQNQDIDTFYDCQEPPVLRHRISDTGDICPDYENYTLPTYVQDV